MGVSGEAVRCIAGVHLLPQQRLCFFFCCSHPLSLFLWLLSPFLAWNYFIIPGRNHHAHAPPDANQRASDATPQRQRFNYGRDKTALYFGLVGTNAAKFAFKVMTAEAFSLQIYPSILQVERLTKNTISFQIILQDTWKKSIWLCSLI
jgi:hypothetical protein